jgi:hypothetical protein
LRVVEISIVVSDRDHHRMCTYQYRPHTKIYSGPGSR